MNNPITTLTSLAERHEFDEIIDVRSPAEFAQDHIPGARNLPVLDNEERVIVGTLHKQASPFEARRIGAAMVARNIARHLDESLHDKPKHWRPLIYCWRGGTRSGSFVTWLRLIGWRAMQMNQGYKAWRHYVIERLQTLPTQFTLRVVCGPTGSAKTRLLQALAAHGEQVLDLEALAAHKGSVLGALPQTSQPSQKAFESQLCHLLEQLDPTRPVYLEAESRKIGRISVPEALHTHMHQSDCIVLEPQRAARIDYLLRDYAYLGDDPHKLQQQLLYLKGLIDNATLQRWLDWAAQRQLAPLFAELIDKHYDPCYARSQGNHYSKLSAARRYCVDDLSTEGLTQLAATICADQ